MKREFNATSGPLRAAFAAVALLASLASLGTVDALARHYDAQAQLARVGAFVVARAPTSTEGGKP